jgi:hypothetical protein
MPPTNLRDLQKSRDKEAAKLPPIVDRVKTEARELSSEERKYNVQSRKNASKISRRPTETQKLAKNEQLDDLPRHILIIHDVAGSSRRKCGWLISDNIRGREKLTKISVGEECPTLINKTVQGLRERNANG